MIQVNRSFYLIMQMSNVQSDEFCACLISISCLLKVAVLDVLEDNIKVFFFLLRVFDIFKLYVLHFISLPLLQIELVSWIRNCVVEYKDSRFEKVST